MNAKKLICTLNVTGLLLLAGSVFADPLSTEPVPRTKQFSWMSLSNWYEWHAADVALAEQGQARVVFLGDSITQGWDHELWEQHFAPLGAVNFAIGGDLTQNMLWRLDHGNVEKLDPELVVLMAGVNNYLHHQATPEDTFLGVKAVVDRALDYYPNANLILQGILPFGEQPNTPERHWVKATNSLLQQLENNPRVVYYDFGDLFLEDDGRISAEVMGDFLHPGRKGYETWIEQLLFLVKSPLGETK
ncbi:GDSL-type esterase/lipase family protein [Gilvimarinus sp. SDUM040013]|uniref:GDSL-type esterase/lipase family protein n=1 Tax=Gilvimarinus gilvus TaxID=3058038 RepID=A0ABU4RT62_9GAMM|nr:GDSL-type esterase/lipase family protein [Gilvimarinus sp. SDUM040013]MDO3387026.1 GDSL-type esterase/lipase family protein [Gilvimarinus sp. SDUM040013]MDX6848080.1 GDSL-type esterase/lipase family protein [Gilvimarinus sp. SDUM040013]